MREVFVVAHTESLHHVEDRVGGWWIGMALEDTGSVDFRASPGGITHLTEDDRFHNRRLTDLYDTRHLRAPDVD